MKTLVDFPILIFLVSFVALWLCAWVGASFLGEYVPQSAQATAAFSLVLTATLTLLGLIIAFSFSMAIGRYDQRKNYEEAEANAIGTEYLRADLLPARLSRRRARCCVSMRTSASFSTVPATRASWARSTPGPVSYRPRCGSSCPAPPPRFPIR